MRSWSPVRTRRSRCGAPPLSTTDADEALQPLPNLPEQGAHFSVRDDLQDVGVVVRQSPIPTNGAHLLRRQHTPRPRNRDVVDRPEPLQPMWQLGRRHLQVHSVKSLAQSEATPYAPGGSPGPSARGSSPLPKTQSAQSARRLSLSRSRHRRVRSSWFPSPHGSPAPQPAHGRIDEQNTRPSIRPQQDENGHPPAGIFRRVNDPEHAGNLT